MQKDYKLILARIFILAVIVGSLLGALSFLYLLWTFIK